MNSEDNDMEATNFEEQDVSFLVDSELKSGLGVAFFVLLMLRPLIREA